MSRIANACLIRHFAGISCPPVSYTHLYDAVILPIFGGFDKLYFRNLLYTAVTRAKKLLIIVGNRGRVEYMVQNNRKMLRYTNLRNFLTEAVQHGS